MFKKKISFFIMLAIFLFSANLSLAEDTITVSRVSDNLSKHQKRLKPFIDYLTRHLEHVGIKRGKVLLARNNQELIKLIKQGKVDIVTETPFSSMFYCDKAGMKILLRRWKGGVPSYHSVIFARKDSGINSLDDLKGKVIAFEDPGSTSGYSLPKAAIIKEGFRIVELSNYKKKPPSDKIGYCFAKSEVNIGHWVHKGFAAAGVVHNLEYQNPEQVPAEYMPDFKIVYETEDLPRNLILVRPDMDPELEQEIKNILLNMKLTEEGRKIMLNMDETKDFDEFPGDPDQTLEKIRQLYKYISAENYE